MIEYTFRKEHTLIAKGVAMLLMLFDHLFWLDSGEYSSIFPISIMGQTIEWNIGSIGNICVAMYLTLSGYGMYYAVKNNSRYSIKDSLIRVKNIWITYVIITVPFILIEVILGKIEINIPKILLNVFLLDYSYNKYAWFMITYVVVILVFPICYRILSRMSIIGKICLIVGIKVFITIANKAVTMFIGTIPYVAYITLFEPFMFLSSFLIGYVCAEYNIFEKLYIKLFKGRYEKIKLLCAFASIMIFIFLMQYTILDTITAPVICMLCAYLFNKTVGGKLLTFIGKYSIGMWLIHYHIMITLLNEIVYMPKLSVLILVWIICMMIPMCKMVDKFNLLIKRL